MKLPFSLCESPPKIIYQCRRCGSYRVHARGLCQSCYDDWRRFGGLRIVTLGRVPLCPGCRRYIPYLVHHREPGRNSMLTLIPLCLRCHTRIHRTLFLRAPVLPFFAELWFEVHRGGIQQLCLPFMLEDSQDMECSK